MIDALRAGRCPQCSESDGWPSSWADWSGALNISMCAQLIRRMRVVPTSLQCKKNLASSKKLFDSVTGLRHKRLSSKIVSRSSVAVPLELAILQRHEAERIRSFACAVRFGHRASTSENSDHHGYCRRSGIIRVGCRWASGCERCRPAVCQGWAPNSSVYRLA